MATYTGNKGKFAEGNPGRPPGSQNRRTVEIRELAQRIMTDRKYLRALVERIREGSAPHMETLMAHYAWGKPKEHIEVTGIEITALEVLLLEARNGSNGNGGNGHAIEIEAEPIREDENKDE